MTDPDIVDMTGVMRGMWVHEQFDSMSVVNRLGYAFRVRGAFDLDAYERAVRDRVATHPLLRSSVVVVDGEPRLRIHDELDVGVERVDILGWPEDRIAALMQAHARAAYDLDRGPLVRFLAGKVSDDEHVILIAAHHLVADMWSLSVLGWELGEAYAAIGSGDRGGLRQAPRSSFARHAAAERRLVAGPEGDGHLDYWRSQLRGFDPAPVLRTDRPRALDRDHHGDSVSFELTAAEAERLNAFSHARSTTPANVLLAAYFTVLARNSGRDDLAVTTVRAGRSARSARVQGCFVQPIVLRIEVDRRESFSQFLRRVDTTVADGFAHGDYPLHDLMQHQPGMSRDGYSPFTALGFSFQKTTRVLNRDVSAAAALGRAGVATEVGGVCIETTAFVPEPAPSEIGLRVAEVGDGYVVGLQYMSSLFDRATAETLAGHVRMVLRAVLDESEHPVGSLPMLTDAEIDRLRTWESPQDSPSEVTVDQMIEQSVAEHSDSIAIRQRDHSLTYAEVGARADRLGERLRAEGVGPGSVVGLAVPHSIGAVVAAVGIVATGAAYIPLSLDQPDARIRSVIDDCSVDVVVVGHDDVGITDVTCVRIDAEGRVARRDRVEPSPVRARSSDPVYVMSTSGSTGQPKHVVVEHRNLVSLIRSLVNRLDVGSDDVVMGQASMAFDMSVPDVFLTLAVGATLVLVDDEARVDAGRLLAEMEATAATVMFATPTTCRRLLFEGWAGDPRLTLVSCGEVLAADLAADLVPITGALWNGYGPTENTVAATAHRVEVRDEPVVPIGRPIDNTGCIVLDAVGERVPDGVVGELLLTGHGVARGYLGLPDETARRFVEIPSVDAVRTLRAYRTGDLVSRRSDGVLVYHGRIDDQFKLRGFRIEPAEIEAALVRHPSIEASAVAVRRVGADDDRLVAFVVLASGVPEPSVAELRAHLGAMLPRFMIPTLVVPVEGLPSTVAGKVDRNALPDVDGGHASAWDEAVFEEPLAGDEATVAEIWREVFGAASVGRHEDFFDLGGHSLLATKIASRLRSRFDRAVDVTTVFRHPTVATLAAAMQALPALGETVVVESGGDAAPLTYSQERMWFIHRMNPDNVAYNLAGAIKLHGRFDIDAFRSAIQVVIGRHDSLRTVFEQVDGVPVQRVVPDAVSDLDVIDLRSHDAEHRWDIANQMMVERAQRPFDLTTLPLVEFVLFMIDAEEHALLLVQHHIVSDQWSAGILAEELSATYADLLHGRTDERSPQRPQLADFARRHRSEVESDLIDTHLAYWTNRLDGLETVDLPADRPRPARRSARGAAIEAAIPSDLVLSIGRACRREGVTPFMVTLAAFQILISRYTGARDVAVGTAVANRHRLDSERVVGSLVNSLVMRADVDETLSFRQFLRAVSASSLEAFAHQDMPFARLVAEMGVDRDPNRSPLFQVFFNVQNAPFAAPALDGVEVERIHLERSAAQFDVSLSIDPDERRAVLEYDVELFDRRRMERLLDHYWRLLGALLDAPDRPMVDAPMVVLDERATAAPSWRTTEDGRRSSLLHTLFEESAAERPAAPAVTFGGETVAAAALNARANRLARTLRSAGVGHGDLVGIMLDRSIDMLASVLAVLKCGGAYVPLDPEYPVDRLRFIIEQSELKLVVYEGGHQPVGAMATEFVDVSGLDLESGDGTDLDVEIAPDDLAYVIYTSGSTGRPKGVQITHANAVNFVRSMLDRPGIDAHDSVLASTTLSFDISVLEIFATLAGGARIVLVRHEDQMDPHALAVYLDDVSIAQGTPTMWKMLLDSGWAGRPDLTILCGGEALSQSLADRLTATDAEVWNMYGPTETTVWSSTCRLRRGDAVTLGEPVANTTLLVLDQYLRPVPDGVVGELWIGGLGVASGYLGRPDLTSERFFDDPFSPAGAKIFRTGDSVRRSVDGDLEFLGRVDQQVKVRGHRIELGEIEAVLAGHPDVVDAVVSSRSFGPDDERLVAYYRPVSVEDRAADSDLEDALRELAVGMLPTYMVPAAYVALDDFPTTPNNKVDRARLPEPVAGRSPSSRPTMMPRPGLETEIAEMWSDVLGVDLIGRHDNFFQLGGHSLLAVRCFARLDRHLGREVPLTTLFEHPTLAEFVAAVDEGSDELSRSSVIAINPDGPRTPFFYVSPFLITLLSFANLSEHLGVDQPFYGIQPQGMESDDPIHDSVEEMAEHYVAEMRSVQPCGPYLIGGHCSGSWVAFEMVRQLQAVGEQVDLLMLVDFGPPQGEGTRTNLLRYVVERVRLYQTDGRLLDAVRWQVGLLRERFLVRRIGGSRNKRVAEVRARHASAHARYEPTPIEGGAVLVRTAESVQLADRAWHLDWRRLLTGPLRVEVVGGTHAGLVEDANSQVLAGVIRRSIDEVVTVDDDSATRLVGSA